MPNFYGSRQNDWGRYLKMHSKMDLNMDGGFMGSGNADYQTEH